MSLHATSRPLAAAAVAAALLLLPALPASAAIVNDANIPLDIAAVPPGSPIHVRFTHEENGTVSQTFPAGTYWIEDIIENSAVLPLWVEGLTERYAARTTTYTRVVLDAPGPLTFDSAAIGTLGRGHLLTALSMPAGYADPATLTPDQIRAALEGETRVSTVVAEASVVGASTTRTLALPVLDEELHLASQDGVWNDFLGIDVATFAVRVGNVYTIGGVDGASGTMAFGRAGDEWVTGDWDGDGRATMGLRRGNILYLDNDGSGGLAGATLAFGRADDNLLVGDWDGDGKDTFAVQRDNVFYVINDLSGGVAPISFAYGRATDEAWADDWDKDGKDSISVARLDGAEHHLYVKNSLAGGSADSVHIFGPHGE